jgi:predicted nucleotidyltransferase
MYDDIMAESMSSSRRFLLRLPAALHERLTRSARTRGISLNEHCIRSLAGAEAGTAGPLGDAVAKALTQLGSAVVGIAVFGSWARGEAGPASDVDLLVVLSPEVEITRGLYDTWDGVDLRVGGHRVEPHFVRMRSEDDGVSGFWAEVALDAAVVYDPELALARELARVRRALVSGELVRRTSGGRSWWTAA